MEEREVTEGNRGRFPSVRCAARPEPKASAARFWPRSLSFRARLALAGFLFVLPALIHIAVFKVYPLIQAFGLSFYRYDLMSPPVFIGLDNYRALWANPLFHQSFWVSVKYMFGVSIPEWFLALGLALLLNRS